MKKRIALAILISILTVLSGMQPAGAAKPATVEEWVAQAQAEKVTDINLEKDSYSHVFTPISSYDPGRVLKIPQGNSTFTAAGTGTVTTAPIHMEDACVVLHDDVTLIRETDANWFRGLDASGGLQMGGSGFSISGNEGKTESGTKIVLQETDGTLYTFVSDGMDGNVLKVNKSDDRHALCYYRAVHLRDMNSTIPIGLTLPIPNLGEVELEGNIILRGDGYEGEWDWDVWGYPFEISFSAELELEKVIVKIEKKPSSLIPNIKLGEIEVPIVPGIVSVDFTPEIFLEASVTGEVGFKFDIEEGIRLKGTRYIGIAPWINEWDRIHSGPEASFIGATLEGEIYAGLEWGPALEILEGLLGVGLKYKGGVVVQGKMNPVGHYDAGDSDHLIYHACEPMECCDGKAFPRLGPLAIEAIICGFSKELWALTNPIDFDPFANFYYSATFKDGSASSPCPHKGYKLQVKVRGSDGKPLQNATVSYEPLADADKKQFADESTGITDGNGLCELHIPKSSPSSKTSSDGNTVMVTASIKDSLNPGNELSASKFVTERGINADTGKPDPEDVTLVIDTRTVTISFEDSGSGKISGLPDPLRYHPSQVMGVQLPDNIPEKSGLHFTGWNTEKNGSGTAYMPGVFLESDKDMVLYAQFQVVFETYVVLYNANGGSDAPMAQVTLLGEPTTLRTEKPEWGGYHFLGWSYQDDSSTIDFPHDQTNVLQNPENQRVITLYAVWGFDPVDKPVKLSYNMNGGPEQQKPSDRWTRKNGWMPISQVVPVWDDMHLFRGWSTDENAGKGKYDPGEVIQMDRDITLYAIWGFDPVPEPACLTFQDTGSGAASGIPSPVYFSPDPGTIVTIPDAVPRKSGLHFTGWNTEEDGTGTFYPPGSSLAPGGNMTLYAQWQVIRNSYVILYHTNGGSRAPGAQIVSLDEIAVLPTEPAVWANYRFLGWALDANADMPDYPYGIAKTLSNPEGKPLIELFAVWQYNPVEKPKELSYNMNGGPEEQKPASRWIQTGGYLTISSLEPVWDGQHIFRGWSPDPNASDPLYSPGDTLRMDKNVRLYAVWKIHYTITEGNGAHWKIGFGKDLRLKADGNINYFHFLEIDGNVIYRDQYRLFSGSTVADLPPALLKKLGTGTHTVRFVYYDGTADGTFTIDKPVPKTGDGSHPLLWTGLVLLGILTIGMTTARKKE